MKFTLEIEIPDQLVEKMSAYSFINIKEWKKFADGKVVLPPKLASFLQEIVVRQITKMEPNKTWDYMKNLPEATQLLVLKRLNVPFDEKKKDQSIKDLVNKIEEDNNCRIIFGMYDETVTAYMLPRQT